MGLIRFILELVGVIVILAFIYEVGKGAGEEKGRQDKADKHE